MFKKKTSDKIIITIFALFFLGKMLFRDVLKIALFNNFYLKFTSDVIILILVVLLNYNRLFNDYKEKFCAIKIKERIKSIVLLYVVSAMSRLVSSIIFEFCMHRAHIISTNQVKIDSLIKEYPIGAGLLCCIAAPIIEEYIVREIIYMYLTKVGTAVAIIGSGIIFGLLHFSVAINETTILIIGIQSITYIANGIYLGYIRYKYNSLIETIFLHFVLNTVSFLITVLL